MARRPIPPLPADSPDEVEAAFYAAMQTGDLEQMMALWADEDEAACLHPGGMQALGPAAVRTSFEAIFATGAVNVRPDAVRRYATPDVAVHHVVERIVGMTSDGPGVAYALATNIYIRTPLGWRMLVHHASAGGETGAADFADTGATLH